jgi:sugar lactone lactonase YvrE
MRKLTSLLIIVVVAAAPGACGGDRGDQGASASATPQNPSATPQRTSSAPQRTSSAPARVTRADLEYFYPHGIAVAPDGAVFVADTDTSRVLRVDSKGKITLFSGEPDFHGFEGDGGPAADALLHGPTGLAVDSAGSLYIVDHGNNRVRKVDQEGTITTVVGSGTTGTRQGGFSGDGGPATRATLQEPIGVAVDRSGRLYVADRGNYRVRAVDSAGKITTLAGNGSLAGDGSTGSKRDERRATDAAFALPVGVAPGPQGSVFISDEPAHQILKVDAEGVLTRFAGTGKAGYSGDGGPAVEAKLNEPGLLASDARGNLYFSDAQNHVIRVVNRRGTIRTVAGTGKPGFRGDGGPATEARLNEPYGVAVGASGAIYIADHGNSRVRRVDRSGTITTIVP